MHMPWRRRREPETTDSPEDLLGERLSAFIDDELTPDERTAVEAELAASEDARAMLDDLQMVREALASLEVVRAPRSFALEAPPERSRSGLFSRLELAMRVSTALAAFAFVVVVAGGASLTVPGPTIPTTASDARALSAPGTAAERPSELDSPAPQPDAAPAPADAPSDGPPSDPDDGEVGTAAVPEDAAEGTDADVTAETFDEREELAPTPDSIGQPAAITDSPGGAPAALGVVALLLAALSWLVARARRNTSTG